MQRFALRPSVALLAFVFAHAAFAQDDSAAIAARRELIERAQAAREAGHHDQALDLAQRAGAIQMTPSLRRFVAEEQMALGRFAEALGSAEQCAAEADRDTTGRFRADHLAACRALVADLQTRVAHVVVQMPADVPADAHVRVAGTELPRALWNVPYVVTPGSVGIEVRAEGRAPFQQTAEIARGATVPVTVVLAGTPSVANAASTTSASSEPTTGPASRPRGSSTPAIVVAIAGGAALVAGGIFGGLQLAQVNALSNECGVSYAQCSPAATTARADYDRAVGYTVAADVLMGVGLVALGGGVIGWIVTRNGGRERASRPRVRVWAAGSVAGLMGEF